MKELERSLKALANRRRLAIIALLKLRKEMTVGEIAGAMRLSLKSTSRHLAILFAAAIVEREQRNIYVYYKITGAVPPGIRAIIALL